MPRLRRAWGSWSYERAHHQGAASGDGACVHYWLNALQPVPFSTPLLCSLNPVREPDAARVIDHFEFSHPIFDLPAIAAQRRMPELQGRRRTWFCGAWMGYGFHEDGIRAGTAVASELSARLKPEIRHEFLESHQVGATWSGLPTARHPDACAAQHQGARHR
jgi:predicted NAD/FAD-binding protein